MDRRRLDDVQVIAVVGPTGAGKSDFAVELALALDGEILSGDSMQIYRGMDIGTAKMPPDQRRGIPHHLIDLCEPGERFSAAAYQALARQTIKDIFQRGKRPILAGGTGLYIDSALTNYDFRREEPARTPEKTEIKSVSLRMALQAEADELGPAALWDKLKETDPASAERLHPNDTKRVIRALEYYRIHGKPISANKAAYETPTDLFPTLWIGLDAPREILYKRINDRVDRMMEAGLLDEVTGLYKRGLKTDSQAGQAIGYRQLLQYLAGEYGLDEAVEAIKRESRRYAKRQLTWFRRNKKIVWIDADYLPIPIATSQLFL